MVVLLPLLVVLQEQKMGADSDHNVRRGSTASCAFVLSNTHVKCLPACCCQRGSIQAQCTARGSAPPPPPGTHTYDQAVLPVWQVLVGHPLATHAHTRLHIRLQARCTLCLQPIVNSGHGDCMPHSRPCRGRTARAMLMLHG